VRRWLDQKRFARKNPRMFPTPSIVFALVTAALLGLTSCATQQPLSSVRGGRYQTVSLDPNIRAPERYVYRDLAGKRSRGILGGLIGLAVGAASEGPGFRRFDAAASRAPVDARALVRREIEGALKSSQLLRLVPTNPDSTMRIEIVAYGVAPVSGRQLGAVITARATLTDRSGKTVWQKTEWANSDTSAMLTDIEQNPSLWPRMAREAAAGLARKLILYTSATERSVSPTSM
jgi:hypothetical protein